MEIRRFQRQSPQGVIHVRVEKEFLSYDLADFYNGTEEKTVYRFDPARELQKEKDEKFHAYDFWRDEYLGVIDGESPLELEAFESRVLALHQVADHPQLISTSRHVSQGAVELKNLSWNAETGVLSGVSSLPEDESIRWLWRPRKDGTWRARARKLRPGYGKFISPPRLQAISTGK